MFYIKELWRGIKERPILYLVFIVTVMLCTVISCTFYRLTASQIKGVNLENTYTFDVNEKYDNTNIFEICEGINVGNIYDEITVTVADPSGDSEFGLSVIYAVQYNESDKGFCKAELNTRNPYAIVSIDFAKKHNLSNGDTFSALGVNFTLLRKNAFVNRADVLLTPFQKLSLPQEDVMFHRFSAANKGKILDSKLAKLQTYGITLANKVDFNVSALVGIFVSILVLAVAAINVFVAYNYLSSKSMKRYTVYKTVGATNLRILLIMLLETFSLLFISFFIAIAIDHTLAKPLVSWEYLSSLKVADYFAIFAINVVLVALTLAFRIVKVTKLVPADKSVL